jgi:uncharacterized protein
MSETINSENTANSESTEKTSLPMYAFLLMTKPIRYIMEKIESKIPNVQKELTSKSCGLKVITENWEDLKLLTTLFFIKTLFMYAWIAIKYVFIFLDKITDWPIIGKIYRDGYKPLLYVSMKWPKLTLTALGIIFLASLTQPPKIYYDPSLVDADIVTMYHELNPERFENEFSQEQFVLHNQLILPIICHDCENGVFNVTTLNFIFDLGKYIETLKIMKGEGDNAKNEGVYPLDMGSLSNVEMIYYTKEGALQRPYIQEKHITTQAEALAIRKNVLKNPLLRGSMVNISGNKMALIVPIIEKKHTMDIADKILTWVENNQPNNSPAIHVGISGLVAANAIFSIEMYYVLGKMSPVIFAWMLVLLIIFVKYKWLIPLPFMLMMANIAYIAGLFIYQGNTITLMSSMAPVFMAGFNVLDSIYFVLFFTAGMVKFDTREEALEWLSKMLWTAMFLTTITTATGFLVLMGSVSPPIANFGLYTGLSVPLALVLSFFLLPAFIMAMPQKAVDNIKKKAREADKNEDGDKLWKSLETVIMEICRYSRDNYARPLVFWPSLTVICLIAGIQNGVIDDSGDKWLAENHQFRQHLSGYQEEGAVFTLKQRLYQTESQKEIQKFANEMKKRIHDKGLSKSITEISLLAKNSTSRLNFISKLKQQVLNAEDSAITLEQEEKIGELSAELANIEAKMGLWTKLAMLTWLEKYIEHMTALGNVTKANSFLTMIKLVHRDLEGKGNEKYFSIPPTNEKLQEMIIGIQDGNNADDLFHFVTSNYGETLIMFQLTSADRVPVTEIENRSEAYIANNPPPIALNAKFSDMTHVQKRMIEDIAWDQVESFLACLLLFAFMFYKGFRNIAQVLLSMSVMVMTQIIIFGMTGLTGEAINLPMIILAPVALSACIDIPTHVMSAIKEHEESDHEWFYSVFAGHTGKAIFVNAFIVSLIFVPMGFAFLVPLEPYYDVADFMLKNMALSYLMVITLFPAYFGMMDSRKWHVHLRDAFGSFNANRDPIKLANAIIEEEESEKSTKEEIEEIKAEILKQASQY